VLNTTDPAFVEGVARKYFLYADIPQLNTHDLEFLAIVAQWLVAKRRAGVRDAILEVVV